jgi:hypothetical protein
MLVCYTARGYFKMVARPTLAQFLSAFLSPALTQLTLSSVLLDVLFLGHPMLVCHL